MRVSHFGVGPDWITLMGENTKEVATGNGDGGAGLVLPRLDQGVVDQLVADARESGGLASLAGPDGLLSGLVAQFLETALGVELEDHLGYGPHERRPEGWSNARNGSTPKTVQTDVGLVRIEVPRDCAVTG